MTDTTWQTVITDENGNTYSNLADARNALDGNPYMTVTVARGNEIAHQKQGHLYDRGSSPSAAALFLDAKALARTLNTASDPA